MGKRYYKPNEVDPTFLSELERHELAQLFKSRGFISLQAEGDKVYGQCELCSDGNKDRGIIATYAVALIQITIEDVSLAGKKWLGLEGLQHMDKRHNKVFRHLAQEWYNMVQDRQTALRRMLESKL